MRTTRYLLILALLLAPVSALWAAPDGDRTAEPEASSSLDMAWQVTAGWMAAVWDALDSVVANSDSSDNTSQDPPEGDEPEMGIGPGMVPIG